MRVVQTVIRRCKITLRKLRHSLSGGLNQAQKHRVVRHGIKVQGPRELHVKTARIRNRLAFGKSVGIVRRSLRSHSVAIERVFGMDV